jgi:alpha,alpha-trehalose phosphorylase
MIKRESLLPPEHIYPIDDWKLIEKRFDKRFLAQNETFFSIGNGYLGMRGNFEEGAPVFQSGTFVNGFHETWPIIYGEEAYGFAKTGQTMLNLPDSTIIKLYVDDEPFYLPTANLLDYERVLDMQSGTLDRRILWEMPSGKQVLITSQRLVSFQHRHLAAIRYEVTVLNAETPVVISSEIIADQENQAGDNDPRQAKGFKDRVLITNGHYLDDYRIVFDYVTKNSNMTLACGVDHMIETRCNFSCKTGNSDGSGEVVFSVEAKPGVPICLTKVMAYHTSRRVPSSELRARALRSLDRALGDGFEKLLHGQRQYMDDFWRRSDIYIDAGHPRAQQCIRFNLYHILQAAARSEGAGIAAKGLTGQTYEGHYFWDAEIYVLPFLIYTAPQVARNLLKFRYSMLEKARQRAREVNQKGVLFPWRTINGEEASAYYAAGTAQYHINADIMYALKKYVDVTGDEKFLHEVGAEMLVETARFWCDLGFFTDGNKPKFQIHGVTGPDEYNAIVNNNTYTNLMARHNLRFAAATVTALQKKNPDQFTVLVHNTKLDLKEIEEWQRAADCMYIPFNEELGINPQDDSFLEKKKWDLENTPADKFPLLLFHHPLVIYRHQVIKQADVVLAMLLLGQEFSPEQKKRNFDYYDPLTTGDSSLSVCIQSILATELGYMDKALDYYRYAILMDLSDVGGNVKDGAHIASMGGTWMGLVYGFAGMRDDDGCLSFNPRLPQATKRLRFSLITRGQVLELDITHESVTYLLKSGPGLTIRHLGKEIQLSEGEPKLCGIAG